jgi:hypothetical protein
MSLVQIFHRAGPTPHSAEFSDAPPWLVKLQDRSDETLDSCTGIPIPSTLQNGRTIEVLFFVGLSLFGVAVGVVLLLTSLDSGTNCLENDQSETVHRTSPERTRF